MPVKESYKNTFEKTLKTQKTQHPKPLKPKTISNETRSKLNFTFLKNTIKNQFQSHENPKKRGTQKDNIKTITFT